MWLSLKKTTLGFVAPICEKHLKHKISMYDHYEYIKYVYVVIGIITTLQKALAKKKGSIKT
jgi:hypothetical protein